MALAGLYVMGREGETGAVPLSAGSLARARKLDQPARDSEALECSDLFLFYILVFLFQFIRQNRAPFLHGSAKSGGHRGLRMAPPAPG